MYHSISCHQWLITCEQVPCPNSMLANASHNPIIFQDVPPFHCWEMMRIILDQNHNTMPLAVNSYNCMQNAFTSTLNLTLTYALTTLKLLRSPSPNYHLRLKANYKLWVPIKHKRKIEHLQIMAAQFITFPFQIEENRDTEREKTKARLKFSNVKANIHKYIQHPVPVVARYELQVTCPNSLFCISSCSSHDQLFVYLLIIIHVLY